MKGQETNSVPWGLGTELMLEEVAEMGAPGGNVGRDVGEEEGQRGRFPSQPSLGCDLLYYYYP